MIDPNRLRNAHYLARRDLLAERVVAGHWVGELSSSALSTATAVSAMAVVGRHSAAAARHEVCREFVVRGLGWLGEHQNTDGGWGDTDKSLSNISTTMLVRAAFHLAATVDDRKQVLDRAVAYIESQGGIPALERRYGKDKTFAVPILSNCALAGLVPWQSVPALPFELACLPHAMLHLLRLPVVSYALPALVAIGQLRHYHRKPRNPITWLARGLSARRSLRVLEQMQPASGGFLEATPLTSFVVMSLAAIGHAEHPVVRRGAEFLMASIREDGSWPIDTNLATWNTSLAASAMATASGDVGALGCLDWLLSCQHRYVHPFTRSRPGGWGWTDASGAVPDADDTSAALLALASFLKSSPEAKADRIRSAAADGAHWLLGLQNDDGGWPTFCRGWGTMPFDRSAPDLTAHALRALESWQGRFPNGHLDQAIQRGLEFLARRQCADGSWVPLWFGNQHHPAEENRVYGTARVLLAYRDLGLIDTPPARKGLEWLAANQAPDGGWGAGSDAPSTVEETAVAVEALLAWPGDSAAQSPLERGVRWLLTAVESSQHRQSAPIGLYFARLWYYEKLYPLIFTVSALGHAVRRLIPTAQSPAQP